MAIIFQCVPLSFAAQDTILPKSIADSEVSINGESYVLDSNMAYYDTELETYVITFQMKNGQIKYLSLADQQFQENFSENTLSTEPIRPYNAGLWHFFVRKTEKQVSGSRMKVSADFVAPPGGGTVTKNVSFTASESFSADWTRSKSVSSYSFNVEPGKSGYYMEVGGYYQTWFDGTLLDQEYHTGRSVKLTDSSDEPDGKYQFIYY